MAGGVTEIDSPTSDTRKEIFEVAAGNILKGTC